MTAKQLEIRSIFNLPDKQERIKRLVEYATKNFTIPEKELIFDGGLGVTA